MNVRRDDMLREMGLGPIWRLRGARQDTPDVAMAPAHAQDVAPIADAGVAVTTNTAPVPEYVPPRTLPQKAPDATPSAEPPVNARVDADAVGAMDWEALTAEMLACKACRLCEQRQQAVPGVGDRQADWLFVGEGPGAEEDARGEPFVGKAGQLLDAMMAAIGIKRGEKVYIANTVKCRPPLNRTPEAAELAACFPYLARQIALIRPRLIVALGRPAAQSLLNTEIRIASARGKCFDYDGIPVVVTYHPAYLLRNPMDKSKAWEDLCFARREMARLTGGET